jgi:hypothetical protein
VVRLMVQSIPRRFVLNATDAAMKSRHKPAGPRWPKRT